MLTNTQRKSDNHEDLNCHVFHRPFEIMVNVPKAMPIPKAKAHLIFLGWIVMEKSQHFT